MIIDALTIETGHILQTDLCIVGAGAAGIALALQFEHSSNSVLLLEAGGLGAEQATQALYDGVVDDPVLHPPLRTYRRRAFGGSTGIWGGRCVPFDAIDFEARPWVPGSGWPFGLAELIPYYRRANRLCEAGEFAYTVDSAFPRGMAPILADFRGTRFMDSSIERFSCPTDFGRRYMDRLKAAENIIVLLHANVTELRTVPDGKTVSDLRVQTLCGRRFSVRPRRVVLATGGLEVPRLLLASHDHHRGGIGNAYDQVGRYYMSHIAGTIGKVVLRSGVPRPTLDYQRADDGVYCRRRFALRPAAQRDLQIGNFIARLHHPALHDPSHRTGALSAIVLAQRFVSYEYARRLRGDSPMRATDFLLHVKNVVVDLFGTAGFAYHWLRDHRLSVRKFPSLVVHPRSGCYSIDFHAEQMPNPESRVMLGFERDVLGMQKLHVAWQSTPADLRTIRVALATLADDLSHNGCAAMSYDPETIETAAALMGAYGGHHIGTARMSTAPKDGVVDAQCRVHGMINLYIAGSAVFPTSSQANPTLTVVALALRLADTLKGHKPLGDRTALPAEQDVVPSR